MNSEFIVFVLFVQCIIALSYGINARRKRILYPMEKMAITAFIPVFGLVIPYLGIVVRKTDGEGDLADVFDHSSEDIRNDIRYEKVIEMDKEVNYVPVEEALILNNSTVKRKLIMDTAKEDAYEYISFLKLAMADHDMETSHYAASIVMEVSRNLQEVIQKASVQYEKEKTDLDHLEIYSDIVGKYFRSGLLDEKNSKRYGATYSRLLGELIMNGRFTEKIFREKIETDIEIGEWNTLYEWIEKYREKYPESEHPYLLSMRYFYISNNKRGIDRVLVDLDRTHVNFSREGHEIVKFWSSREATTENK